MSRFFKPFSWVLEVVARGMRMVVFRIKSHGQFYRRILNDGGDKQLEESTTTPIKKPRKTRADMANDESPRCAFLRIGTRKRKAGRRMVARVHVFEHYFRTVQIIASGLVNSHPNTENSKNQSYL